MELILKMINGYKLLIVFVKSFIIDVWQGLKRTLQLLYFTAVPSQLTFTCSAIEALEKGVKYVQR